MMKRILYLDIIRIFACILIIAMHAPIPNSGLNGYVLSTDSLLTVPGIGLFLMVSGALLMPVSIPTKSFLKKRLGKIICPTLFWTLFYMVVKLVEGNLNEGVFWESILSIPFSPQFNGVLWFMYMIAGLYILAPVLSPWLRQASQWEIVFYLGLWGITLCYPVIRSFVHLNESYTGILYYLGGYLGYFVLGYYLRNYVKRMAVWKCLLCLFVPWVVAIGMKYQQVKVDFYDLFGYLSVFVAMMSIAYFMLIKKVGVIYDENSRMQRKVVLISKCCFGIYLVHIFVMRSIIWKWTLIWNVEGVGQIVLVTILTFVGSFLITWLISYLPWAEYLIGFKQRK